MGISHRKQGALLAGLLAMGAARGAHAWCRTTTCSNCEQDPVTNCPTGTPIMWPQLCVSYSMQYEASRSVDLETATSVAERAFYSWQSALCPTVLLHPSIQLDHHFGAVACKVHEYNQ